MNSTSILRVVSAIFRFFYVKLILLLGTIRSHPRLFWRDHQHEFPALSRLARDILSVPATGAGVERLFNSARDICHYRRGSLKPETIRDLMMFMCTSKFDLEDDQRMLMNEYLSHQERQTAKEEKNTKETTFDPISDNDEEEDLASTQPQPTVQPLSERALGKRRKSVISEPDEDENDDDTDVPLPDTQHRVSGRVRKRSKLLDGYELGRV